MGKKWVAMKKVEGAALTCKQVHRHQYYLAQRGKIVRKPITTTIDETWEQANLP